MHVIYLARLTLGWSEGAKEVSMAVFLFSDPIRIMQLPLSEYPQVELYAYVEDALEVVL